MWIVRTVLSRSARRAGDGATAVAPFLRHLRILRHLRADRKERSTDLDIDGAAV